MGKMRGSGRVGIAGRARGRGGGRRRGGRGELLARCGAAGRADRACAATEAPPPRDDKSLYTLPIRRPTGLAARSFDRPPRHDGKPVHRRCRPGPGRNQPVRLCPFAPGSGWHGDVGLRSSPPTTIRIGLTHDSELDVIWQPYGVVRAQPRDPLAGNAVRPVSAASICVPRSTCWATIPSQRRARPRLPCCRS